MPVRIDKTRAIEEALAKVYITIYKEIKKSKDYPDNIPLLQFEFKRKIYDATRAAITQTFAEGHQYVARELKVETFQNDTDTEMIKNETNMLAGMFWNRVGMDAERANLIKLQKQIEAQETGGAIFTPFDILFFLQNIAKIGTTGALAKSTLTKTNQIVDDPELDVSKPTITWRAMQDEKTCQKLPNGLPGCALLDGQEWQYDDPEIPVPGRLGPNGTHPNCRCYLELG